MSNSISNYCRFIGRLVKDPKIIQVEDTHLTNFTLAINEYHKSKENQSEKGEFVKKKTVNYFDFEAWDTGAVALHKYCKKGDIIDVVTTARNNNWTASKGNKKFQTQFRVTELKLFKNNPSYQTSGSNAEKDEG